MTVHQLIRQLQCFPKDLNVWLRVGEEHVSRQGIEVSIPEVTFFEQEPFKVVMLTSPPPELPPAV